MREKGRGEKNAPPEPEKSRAALSPTRKQGKKKEKKGEGGVAAQTWGLRRTASVGWADKKKKKKKEGKGPSWITKVGDVPQPPFHPGEKKKRREGRRHGWGHDRRLADTVKRGEKKKRRKRDALSPGIALAGLGRENGWGKKKRGGAAPGAADHV